ncbi:hypothetical protein J421_1039 [Gemmatirosa kalamazoonensis]|uniref:Uncharacterized protein n=1 Tax=Gemmatirosa kalamazoonensis TaxID=861299 RepID=W0RCQ3_9BACT|nr:hypothetical protein [Gemmatirosa kalamazoonensis]AHG88576.1 hypothetical protein J421_1039 [Gemmatirosa kalamazoonensis]
MRPIQGGTTPYSRPLPSSRRDPAPVGSTALRLVRRVDEPASAADVELSLRVFADGGSITVKRRSVTAPDGSRRTVGIEALIR